MTSGRRSDDRSVNDLILAAERTARATLWEPGAEHVQARLRTFGEVTEAATEAWQALADPRTLTERPADPTLDHFTALAQGLRRTQQRSRWPEPGPGDPHLERAAQLLGRAAELTREGRRPATVASDPAQGAHLARLQVAHVVLVCAHVVGLDLAAYRRQDTTTGRPPRNTIRLPRSVETYKQHLAGFEAFALGYVDGRWLDPRLGKTNEPAAPGRIEAAQAGFERHAHRVLAHGPTLADLHLISRVQQQQAAVTGIVALAAAEHREMDPTHLEHGLLPALTTLEHALGRLASELRLLATTSPRVDRPALEAARELETAMLDITMPLGRILDPEEIAARIDFKSTTAALSLGLAGTASLCQSLGEAIEDPALTAPAQGVKAFVDRMNHEYAISRDQHPGDPNWRAKYDIELLPADLHRNRPVAAPGIVTAALARSGQRVTAAAVRANAASLAARPFSRAQRGRSFSDVPVNGRRQQDHAISTGQRHDRSPSR